MGRDQNNIASTEDDFLREPGAQLWAVPQKCEKDCLLTTHINMNEEMSRLPQTIQGSLSVKGDYRYQCAYTYYTDKGKAQE